VYDVTLTLKLSELHNFTASETLPVFVELKAGQRQKILMLERHDAQAKASYQSSYGWVMGVASARHDYDFLYRVPFKKGFSVHVSQGYNGRASHHGYARHAVDFSVPVGTAIYAARSGKVVALKASGVRGGFDRSYGKDANYIVIEHDDKTFGKYYHLKQHGVVVNVGQKVAQGELIGYSGNTGYSSGPHLHFSVSKVDPKYMQRPITLPFKFKTAAGIVKHPREGDVYVVN
jgi:murein DD-endopeptidase MepM/ murein hydrolase activator NlpD